MCGIVGFASLSTPAVGPLVNGLRRLEYRGYDSAGVALQGADGIRVYKQTGKVAELDKLLKEALVTGDSPLAYAADVRVFGMPREVGVQLSEIRRRSSSITATTRRRGASTGRWSSMDNLMTVAMPYGSDVDR